MSSEQNEGQDGRTSEDGKGRRGKVMTEDKQLPSRGHVTPPECRIYHKNLMME